MPLKLRTLTYTKPLPRRVRKPKGPTARYRAKRRRAEQPVAKSVRVQCVERDGYCRYGKDTPLTPCAGPSEWAHLGEKKRAKTRGMKLEQRHTTAGSLMLCRKHHDAYDQRRGARLWIHPRTEDGANGSLQFIDEGADRAREIA